MAGYLNLWDLFTKQGEQEWATALHPDGSESVVSVDPLAKHATDFATSPTTGQRYAGKWTVEIPGLDSALARILWRVASAVVLGYQGRGEVSPVVPGLRAVGLIASR